MREIPSLQALCLRAVGSHACSAEDTFAEVDGNKNHNKPSTSSRLLRSFHTQKPRLPRTPCIGPGSARRLHANEVDLHHPFIAVLAANKKGTRSSSDNNEHLVLRMQYGNPALDCLQSYIDSLVEMGRFDDTRLKRHFFEEWKANVVLGTRSSTSAASESNEDKDSNVGRPLKRRRISNSTDTSETTTEVALGALSLHNCTLSEDTFESMVDSKMGPHLAILDLTGTRGLTDDCLIQLLPVCTNLQKLSLKNCRRITAKSLRMLQQHGQHLKTLDVGGAFNLSARDVLDVLPWLPNMTELCASGLGWTDATVAELVEQERPWKALSLSFSLALTQSALRQSLLKVSSTLQSLSLAFCENVVDNALMGSLGRNLPHVTSLDVRGNQQLSTLTGWYDGRASADLPAQSLIVLGRYSSLSEASVEETKRIHPLEATDLTVVLDGGGMGLGITHTEDDDDEEELEQ